MAVRRIEEPLPAEGRESRTARLSDLTDPPAESAAAPEPTALDDADLLSRLMVVIYPYDTAATACGSS